MKPKFIQHYLTKSRNIVSNHNSQLSWLLPISFWRIFFHFVNRANIAGFLVLIHTQQFDDFFSLRVGAGNMKNAATALKTCNMWYVPVGGSCIDVKNLEENKKWDLFVCVIK